MSVLLTSAGEGLCPAAQTLELVRDGRATAAIVAGPECSASAAALRDGLRQALGVEFEVVAPDEVMAGQDWRLRDEWLERPLILLGNIVNNRAMFALFSQFLEGANASHPGPGRYVLRVLYQPFRRGAHLLSVGASDAAGLEAAVARVIALAREERGAFAPRIEVGDATGPTSRDSTFAGDFVTAVSLWYWQGDRGAGQRAGEVLVAETAKADPWGFLEGGHYDWERYYRPLRQFLASGLLSDEERQQVEARVLAIALGSTDWAGLAALRAAPGTATDLMTRHPISGLIGHFILYDYLAHVAEVPPEKQAEVAEGYARLREHIESLIEDERFMSNEVGTQGADNLSFMADMYLLLGDGRVVERNVLSRMADFYLAGKDNLGFQAGDDAYITCRPGAHRAYSAGGLPLLLAAYFHHDGQYRWLLDNTHHFMSHMQVPQPPDIADLAAGVPAEDPARYRGLNLVPMDPWWHRRCSRWAADEMLAPLQAPPEHSFTKAVFRDGHDPDDAYLMLQGVNLGGPAGGEGFSANSVMRYTELGSILLFANTIKQTSWARSLVSASRGQADPQGIACVLGTHFSTPLVSGVESIQEQEGGLRWSRSLVHRPHGYFVAIDTLTAREEDVYNLTCRWRSYHPGAMVGDRRFEAVDGMLGVRFHLQGADPSTWQVTEEPIDGASRPTMIRQRRRARLKAGESASFCNLFYASDADHARAFELRPWTDRAVLVNGAAAGPEEPAAIGTGPPALEALTAEARLWYVSGDGVVLAGASTARLAGLLSLEAEGEVSLGVLPGEDGTWIENPSPQPVRVTCRPEGATAVRLAGAALPASIDLTPGRHRLDLDPAPLLAQLGREVARLWDTQGAATAPAAPPEPEKLELALQPAWTHTVGRPDYRRHGDVRATAEPPVQIGEVPTWRNGLLGPPSGYGWHGSERAGWLPGVQGTITLDLGTEVDVREVRLVRSRGPAFDPALFRADDYAFTLELSNDGFREDARRREIAEPGFDVLYRENAHYMYTQRFPVLVVPVGERARYLRLTPEHKVEVTGDPAAGYGRTPDGTYSALLQDKETSFMEIEVVRDDREPRLPSRLWCDPFGAPKDPRVLCQAGSQLAMLSAEGARLWERDLGSPLAADPVLADIEGDGRPEILTFTLAEEFAAHDRDGARRFMVDVRATIHDEDTGGLCSGRPACVAAWRPDAENRLEYLFFPHYACYRVTAAPELAVSRVEHPGGNRGGKFAFAVPDVTGDGREELAVVGLYGFCFGVVPSETPLERNELPSYLGLAPLTGYSSGNQEFRLYHDGAVVRDRTGAWLGVVALNPGGIDFFAPTDFRKRWSHFNHPPNLCSLLADLDEDGVPEILVGREDGYVAAYEVTQGRLVGKVALEGAVRSLALLGEDLVSGARVVAGTEAGLTLLSRELRPVAHREGPVESVAVLSRPSAEPLIVAAHSSGEVAAYRLTSNP